MSRNLNRRNSSNLETRQRPSGQRLRLLKMASSPNLKALQLTVSNLKHLCRPNLISTQQATALKVMMMTILLLVSKYGMKSGIPKSKRSLFRVSSQPGTRLSGEKEA